MALAAYIACGIAALLIIANAIVGKVQRTRARKAKAVARKAAVATGTAAQRAARLSALDAED